MHPQVRVQVDSPNMQLPNKDMRVHIDPVQVVMDSGPLTNGLLDLLSVKEKGFSEGKPVQVIGLSSICMCFLFHLSQVHKKGTLCSINLTCIVSSAVAIYLNMNMCRTFNCLQFSPTSFHKVYFLVRAINAVVSCLFRHGCQVWIWTLQIVRIST